VIGAIDYCTKTGKETFGDKEKVKISVFGYVSDFNDEMSALKIKPIVIHRLFS